MDDPITDILRVGIEELITSCTKPIASFNSIVDAKNIAGVLAPKYGQFYCSSFLY